MRAIESVTADLDVCLTDTNRLAIMVSTDEGEFLAEVKDIDTLVAKLRKLELIKMEPARGERVGSCVSTAEVELERRAQQ
jgi:hypothetical protein